MSTVTFDTHKFVRTLRDAGFEERQAEAVSVAFRDAISDSSLVTRGDLSLAVAEIRTDIAGVRGEMNTLKWMMGVLVAVAIANFAKQFF